MRMFFPMGALMNKKCPGAVQGSVLGRRCPGPGPWPGGGVCWCGVVSEA